MNNKQQKQPQAGQTNADNSPATDQAANPSALQNRNDKSQQSGQVSGGAMPSIQGANQSREAEQNDLRKQEEPC